MTFEPTITLGQVVTAVAFLLGGVAAYARFSSRVAVMEVKVNDMWAWFVRAGRVPDRRRPHEENNG